jgi:hypothetical protein
LPLQRIGEPIAGPDIEAKDRPTAAAVSPDGQCVAIRTTHWIAFHRTTDLVGGRWREAFRTDVSGLGEPQGEGVTFAGNDTVILVAKRAASEVPVPPHDWRVRRAPDRWGLAER